MTDFDLILRGGHVVSNRVSPTDIAIKDGRIAAIGHELGTAKRELEVTDRLVTPGGVDPHCHIEQISGMGLKNADDFASATRSAALGGTTSVISFAAQAKGQSLRETVSDYSALARQGAHIDHAFHLSVTDTSVEGFYDDLGALIDAGHRSIKVFTTYNIKLEDRAILDIMATAKAHGALVCVHAENDALIQWTKDALLASGLTHPVHHAISHPRLAEIEAVDRMIRFSEFLDQPVMLFHISTAEAVESIRNAKARGVPVWAETCPHYLLMTAEVLDRPGVEGGKWMCSPPQRRVEDQDALWAGLADGTIDLISSDHAPYRFDETGKLSAGSAPRFDQIANGLPGLEVRLPLMFDAIVSQKRGTPMDFVALTSGRAAALYGLPEKGRIAVGADADLVVWDANRTTAFGPNDLHDNVGYNPWEGRSVTGWPDLVLLRGEVVVEDNSLATHPGQGRWMNRDGIGARPKGTPAAEVAFLERHK